MEGGKIGGQELRKYILTALCRNVEQNGGASARRKTWGSEEGVLKREILEHASAHKFDEVNTMELIYGMEIGYPWGHEFEHM